MNNTLEYKGEEFIQQVEEAIILNLIRLKSKAKMI